MRDATSDGALGELPPLDPPYQEEDDTEHEIANVRPFPLFWGENIAFMKASSPDC
jgi:hypothetical protein